jgi:hypothetical protein
VFGRRRREEAAAEAAREEDRLALFARLAERPEHICPFLGLASERTGYVDGVSDEHRCYAFGDPAPLSAEQQTRVCQERGYGNCPRYLRGVLVIPTEELEALRRPRPAAPRPASPPPAAARPQERRRFPLAILLVLLLAIGAGGGVAYLLLGEAGDGIADATPTPSPTSFPSETARSTASVAPSVAATPVVLPSAGETVPPLPTPAPGAVSTGYILVVTEGEYPVFLVDDDGEELEERTATFSRVSGTTLDLIVASDGTRYWRTSSGKYTGLAYVAGRSGDFEVYETFENPDGSTGFSRVPPDEL